MGRRKPQTKTDRVVHWIEEQLGHANPILPSIQEIAQECSVSYLTAWKAVGQLRDRGILACSQGRKARARTPGDDPQGPDGGSASRLVERIKAGILAGLYPAGRNLPKVAHFVTTERASSRTVVAALDILHRGNFIHRQGRAWLAGPRPKDLRQPAPTASTRPVVLIVLHDEEAWAQLYASHLVTFFIAFGNELMYSGMQTMLAVACKTGATSLVPSGPEEIESAVKALGARYRGAVLLVYPWGNGFDFGRFLGIFSVRQRPVVFFDFVDNAPQCDRRAPSSSAKSYFRFHVDQEAATRLAVEALAESGHRKIGIPRFTRGTEFMWVDGRIEQLRRHCAALTPPAELIVVDQTEDFWRFDTPPYREFASLVRVGTEVPDKGKPGVRPRESLRARLLKSTPSLVSLLKQKVTALIALNDSMAREYYFWLKSVGISVPEQITLISFDNCPESQFLPISTVDVGLSQLGYLAAHAIIEDMQIKTDKNGNLAGVCRIMDRGSLGLPGED